MRHRWLWEQVLLLLPQHLMKIVLPVLQSRSEPGPACAATHINTVWPMRINTVRPTCFNSLQQTRTRLSVQVLVKLGLSCSLELTSFRLNFHMVALTACGKWRAGQLANSTESVAPKLVQLLHRARAHLCEVKRYRAKTLGQKS